MERLAAGTVSDPTAAAVPLAASTVVGWVARTLTSAATLAPRVEALLMAMTVQQRLCGCPSLSTSLMAPDMIKAAGAAIVGFRIAYPDVSPEALGKTYPKLLEEYKKAYGEGPISGFHAQAYDAAELLMKAIQKVAKTEGGTTYIGRKALRDAVFSTKFDGTSGPIACDAHGECGEFKPAVYEYTNADPATFTIGKNPKKIWP